MTACFHVCAEIKEDARPLWHRLSPLTLRHWRQPTPIFKSSAHFWCLPSSLEITSSCRPNARKSAAAVNPERADARGVTSGDVESSESWTRGGKPRRASPRADGPCRLRWMSGLQHVALLPSLGAFSEPFPVLERWGGSLGRQDVDSANMTQSPMRAGSSLLLLCQVLSDLRPSQEGSRGIIIDTATWPGANPHTLGSVLKGGWGWGGGGVSAVLLLLFGKSASRSSSPLLPS